MRISHNISKIFDRFIFNKTKNKNKHFCRYCLQNFSSEKVLQEHKKIGLKINSKESVQLKCSWIKFKNQLKLLAVPLKIYADVESCLCKMKKEFNQAINDRHVINCLLQKIKV